MPRTPSSPRPDSPAWAVRIAATFPPLTPEQVVTFRAIFAGVTLPATAEQAAA